MNNKKLFLNSFKFIILPTLVSVCLFLFLSYLSVFLQEIGSALMPLIYYLSKALNYAVYFIWCAFLCVLLIRKKFLFSLLLTGILFLWELIRIFFSFVLSYGLIDIEYFLPSSALGALFECGTILLMCTVSLSVFFVFCAIKAAKCKQNITFSQNEAFSAVISVSSSAAFFTFELIREISYTVSFVSAQFGVIYSSEIWSIILDYVFLLLVFLMGYFVSLLYIRLFERSV